MILRSDRPLGSFVVDLASRAPTRGSGTQTADPLEPIREDTSSESNSINSLATAGEMESSEAHSMERNNSAWRKGKIAKNPFDNTQEQMEFKINLQFQHTNTFGAEIYRDPLDCYAFKTTDHRTPFNEAPMVYYQGDLYIGQDGARYEITKHAQRIDPY